MSSVGEGALVRVSVGVFDGVAVFMLVGVRECVGVMEGDSLIVGVKEDVEVAEAKGVDVGDGFAPVNVVGFAVESIVGVDPAVEAAIALLADSAPVKGNISVSVTCPPELMPRWSSDGSETLRRPAVGATAFRPSPAPG